MAKPTTEGTDCKARGLMDFDTFSTVAACKHCAKAKEEAAGQDKRKPAKLRTKAAAG